MSKQPQPAPTASAVDPCPTLTQISRSLVGERHEGGTVTEVPGHHVYSFRQIQLKLKRDMIWDKKKITSKHKQTSKQ